MLFVLLAMIAGMGLGFLFRGRQKLFVFLDPATSWIVRLLLFLLGFGIGSDKSMLTQMPVLGVKGLILAVAAIIGSVAAARLIVGVPRDDSEVTSAPPASTARGAGGGRWKSVLGSLIAAAAFLLGLPAGILVHSQQTLAFDPATAVLYLLMFLVGIGAGADPTAFTMLKKHGIRLVLLPVSVIVGTAAGTLLIALIWPSLPIRESMAVGAGFGYYSLSSLVIRELSGGEWAAVALLSNISREILTLLFAPLLVKIGGPAAPAAAGAATSMDTTLAATVQNSGRAWAVPALFSGVVLTLLTPFAVTLILTL
jgi:uncharacterized membrane protein YbjE (DUF340 family)